MGVSVPVQPTPPLAGGYRATLACDPHQFVQHPLPVVVLQPPPTLHREVNGAEVLGHTHQIIHVHQLEGRGGEGRGGEGRGEGRGGRRGGRRGGGGRKGGEGRGGEGRGGRRGGRRGGKETEYVYMSQISRPAQDTPHCAHLQATQEQQQGSHSHVSGLQPALGLQSS